MDERAAMSGKSVQTGSSTDRRSARTRRMLHQALMQLIVSKDYESITVQDLIDEADIGRSTFYAHYAGKDDLLRQGFEHLRAELGSAEKPGGVSEPLAFSAAMFVHAERYKDIYRALVGSRGNGIVLAEIRKVLLDRVLKDLGNFAAPDVPKELMARFLVDSFQSVLTWWLERRPKLSAGEIDTIFRNMLGPTLRSVSGSAAHR